MAVRFLALISLALGVPVLFSAVAATRRERLREGGLSRVSSSGRAPLSLLHNTSGVNVAIPRQTQGSVNLRLSPTFAHREFPAFQSA